MTTVQNRGTPLLADGAVSDFALAPLPEARHKRVAVSELAGGPPQVEEAAVALERHPVSVCPSAGARFEVDDCVDLMFRRHVCSGWLPPSAGVIELEDAHIEDRVDLAACGLGALHPHSGCRGPV